MTTKRILIIDDDSRNIFALQAVLQSKGYECIAAPSALEGMKLMANGNNVSVVLMDMMMPDMDGYEAVGKMKTDEQLKDIPVIAVTAQAMAGDKEKCLEAGADDYISKPIDIDRLVTLLDGYIIK